MISGIQLHRLLQQSRVKDDGCNAAGILAVPVRFGPAVCGQFDIGVLQDVILEVLNRPFSANKKERIPIIQHAHL